MMKHKLISLLLALLMLLPGFSVAEDDGAPVVILFTNDVHCGVEDGVGYAGLAAYEAAYEHAGYEVLLADCGDAVQGAPVGALSKGESIIEIMNGLGYDVATIGNHEFDYGMERFRELAGLADYPYIACNFVSADGECVLPASVILEAGGYRIGFVGVATPETVSKTSPTYFQNEDGEFVYGFCGGGDGAELYAAVQSAVDELRADGADAVIALAHLGIDGSSAPWTSSDVIRHTTGIDAVLDGHSHSVIPGETVLNAAGEPVLLASTGTKFANIGALILSPGGDGIAFSAKLHDETLFRDPEAEALVDGVLSRFEDALNEVVAVAQVDLVIYDPMAVDETGAPIRIVRSQETNLGDLCADAYRYITGADIAMMNGGGVRDEIPAGEVTFGQIIAVNPFGNSLMVVEITGQELLDYLELCVSLLPMENGSFQHVSGMTFEVDATVPSPVVTDELGALVEIDGPRRVRNVTVGGEPLDLDRVYTLASNDHTLEKSVDGQTIFADNPVLQREIMQDHQALIEYVTEALGGVIGEAYADPYGDGRITILGE